MGHYGAGKTIARFSECNRLSGAKLAQLPGISLPGSEPFPSSLRSASLWRVPWDKQPLINAKSETIAQLPTFKPHLQNRCLILADGFFEKGIRFIQPGEPLFAMAGLWQPDAEGGKFTLLTTTPNASVSPYHHRMPFILRAEQLGAWLGDDWLPVLENPDRAPLEKIQKQPELF